MKQVHSDCRFTEATVPSAESPSLWEALFKRKGISIRN